MSNIEPVSPAVLDRALQQASETRLPTTVVRTITADVGTYHEYIESTSRILHVRQREGSIAMVTVLPPRWFE